MGQLFRMMGYMTSTLDTALSLSGVIVLLFVLFSGFILPPSQISNGWIWFYWISPVSWVLKALTVNQFLSGTYAFTICTNFNILGNCTQTQQFGDVVLMTYGNPTQQAW